METTATMPRSAGLQSLLRRADGQAIAVWALGFGLVVYLGLNGGGYDPIVRDQLGIAVWWGVLLGLAVGALPLNRLRYGSWVALGLLTAYVAWVALSQVWSDVPESSAEDMGRVVTYLGIFALALSIRSSKGARRMAGALGSGIAVVALVGLLSRLHPAWFPAAAETVESLSANRSRLAYPLGYWNGLASLVAIGLPLLLYVACQARRIVTQALAAAALPAMALTVYFTFSRGGTLAAVVGLLLFFALAHDRLPKAATTAFAGAGAAILIAGAHQRHALDAGLGGPVAHHQGNELLAMALVVCVGVGFLQAAFALALRNGRRPGWTIPSRRVAVAALGTGIAAVILVGLVAGVPGKASHAWHEFKEAKSVEHGPGRFGSFSSNGRWPFWESTLEEASEAPLIGTGSGSFEAWWTEHREANEGFVHDAHSLYFETLGELGIIGLALIVGFLGWVFVAGARRYLSASRQRRTQLAAVLAGCAAFSLGAAYDWLWELAVLPIAFLLLASVLVSAGERPRRRSLRPWVRAAGVAVAALAMVAIAIPLSSASAVRSSQAAVRDGKLGAALEQAADGERVEPFAAGPPLQRALVLERLARLGAAERAALEAASREPHQWTVWVVLSRLQALRGKAHASLVSYRKARALNPHSPIFRP
jgi:hypothetical protein